jgi:hypothetical protein
LPSSFAFNASSMAIFMAWALSGAGIIPSVLANSMADSKTAVCPTACASINPS